MKHLVLILFVAIQYGLSAQCTIDTDFDYAISGGNISFTNTTNNEPANPGYYWEYGGQTSSSENPTFFYSAGIPFACLTVWDVMGTCSDTTCISIVDSSGCNLDVNFNYWVGTTTISFNDLSTGVPAGANYDWSYGTQSSSAQNPTFNIESGDVYTCLTVYDSTWTCHDSVCVMVNADTSSSCNLVLDWTESSSGGMITFTNTSTGEPSSASYAWLYGSQSSSLENPTFTFDPAVTQVCFAINDLTGNNCDDSICGPVMATDSCDINVSWTASESGGIITFTNTSTNEPANPGYYWEYGGQTSTDENPSFFYSLGFTTACLTVWDIMGTCADTVCAPVILDSAGCNLVLDWTESSSGGMITFTNTSTGEPSSTSYAWLYGSQSSSLENPTFTFDPAVTQVCFAINDLTGNNCDDSICGPVMATDSCDINVSWTASESGGIITFTNTSTNEPANPGYYWEYGGQTSTDENPSFFYSLGFTTACLTVWDIMGTCADTVCAPVILDSSGCNLDVNFNYWVGTTTISFNDLSTGVPAGANYDWSYGTQSSSAQNPTFNIESGDVYTCLTVYDSTWTCHDSVCVFINADSIGGCNLSADFTMTIDSGYVYFTNTSTGEPVDANYDWWYNGQSSSAENPMFMLNDSGAWACLTVYDSLWNCYDSTCFFVDPATASNVEIEQLEVQLFPNPATSEVNLTFTKTTATEIVIYDASGRLVKQLYPTDSANKLSIDIADFEKGIYIINVIDSQTSTYITKRFVKL